MEGTLKKGGAQAHLAEQLSRASDRPQAEAEASLEDAKEDSDAPARMPAGHGVAHDANQCCREPLHRNMVCPTV